MHSTADGTPPSSALSLLCTSVPCADRMPRTELLLFIISTRGAVIDFIKRVESAEPGTRSALARRDESRASRRRPASGRAPWRRPPPRPSRVAFHHSHATRPIDHASHPGGAGCSLCDGGTDQPKPNTILGSFPAIGFVSCMLLEAKKTHRSPSFTGSA